MKRRYKPNVFRDIYEQPYSDVGVTRMKLYKSTKNSLGMVQRLDLMKRLPVHNGCVNSISWNESGDYILSGSDDQHIVISHGFTHKVLTKFKTCHRANIFSAKFLPGQGDRHIVSCSGDGIILFTDLNRPQSSSSNQFSCHLGTTYDVVTIPNDSHSFLSCGEDGTVRWFDLRVKDKCRKASCKDDILITCQRAVTSLSLNPTAPYQLAVGCSDSRVRLFDRRKLGTVAAGYAENARTCRPLCTFTVPALKERSCRITSLNYSPDGDEILVSFSSDLLYLFSMRDRASSDIAAAEDCDVDGPSSERSPAPVRRLRLRGDWSDTGPHARPERDGGSRGSGEFVQTRRTLHSSLMQRMTDVLSRMLNDPATRANLNGARLPPRPPPDPVSPEAPVFPFEHPLNDSFSVNPFLPLDSPMSPDPEPAVVVPESDDLQDAPSTPQVAPPVPVNESCGSPMSPDRTSDDTASVSSPGPHGETCDPQTSTSDLQTTLSCTSDPQSTPNALQTTLPCTCDPPSTPNALQTTVCNCDPPSTPSVLLTTLSCTCDPPSTPNALKTTVCNCDPPSSPNPLPTTLPCTCDPQSALQTTACTCDPPSTPNVLQTTVCNCDPPSTPSVLLTTLPCTCDPQSALQTTACTCDPPSTPSVHQTTLPCACASRTSPISASPDPNECLVSTSQTSSASAEGLDSALDQSMPLNSLNIAQPPPTVSASPTDSDVAPPKTPQHDCREHPTEYCSSSSTLELVTSPEDQPGSQPASPAPGNSQEAPRFTLGDPRAKMQLVDPLLDENFARDSPMSPPLVATESVAIQVTERAVSEEEGSGQDAETDSDSSVQDADTDTQQFPRVMYPRPRQVMIPPGDLTQLRNNEDLMDTLHSMRHRHATEPAVLLSVSDVTETGASFAVRLATETNRGPPDIPFLPQNVRERQELAARLQGRSAEEDAPSEHGPSADEDDDATNEDEREDTTPNYRVIHPIEREMDDAIAGARLSGVASEQRSAFQPSVSQVFSGHRNARTMIKEACFWGSDYVMSGSDCGHVFVWERCSGQLVQLFEGDDHVVNCLQPHPTLPILATSGIDYDVKLWAPLAADTTFDVALADMLKKRNEIMLEETKDTITVPATFMIRMLACLNQIRRGGRRNRRAEDEPNEPNE